MNTLFDSAKMDHRRLNRRRFFFFSGIFVLTSLALWVLADLLWKGGVNTLEILILVLFGILFAHISVGFCTALTGFYVLNRGGDRSRIMNSVDWSQKPKLASTAIILPVFNEDVSRVFEGLRVIFRSVEETGHLEHFDFFILSDSNQPNQWVQEEVAWVELCKQVKGFGRIFYRKRRQSINKKAGNVADFLRRWGKNYRYMIVLDADSIMTGDALVKLVTLMEANPRAGIIQTAPRIVRGESLYARVQSFANGLYSPMFLAGLNYWQQLDGNYWGHNAILRIQPFIDHCALPDLPGSEPFGGRILSHDFVEAALMRKAGWSVWLVPEIETSYEEGPPTLIDSAKRDRRWCQGNMQHMWLLTTKGFRPANRFHLGMGVMAYFSSPLWLMFLLLSTIHAFSQSRGAGSTNISAETTNLFGYEILMPQALFLFAFTLVLLFIPKLAALLSALSNKAVAERHGGRTKLTLSAVIEIAISTLLAPINMLFNSKFVVFTLLGQGVAWVTQKRDAGDEGTDWREAILTHWEMTVFGLVWGLSAITLSPMFFWWLSPVILGLLFSIPLSILLSKRNIGIRTRELGLFLSQEETQPCNELKRLEQHLVECYKHLQPIEPLRNDYGFMQAVLDPYVNATHVSLLRRRRPSEESREWLQQLKNKVLCEGPGALVTKEKMAILLDAESMISLHEALWRQPDEDLAAWWKLALRQYNVLTAEPTTALYR